MFLGMDWPQATRLGPKTEKALTVLNDAIDGVLQAASDEEVPIGEKMLLLAGALRARNRLDYATTSLTRAVDTDSSQYPDGGSSCANWLREVCHISGGAAYAQVKLARRLPEMAETSAAFASGTLSAQHASIVARTVERVVNYGGDRDQAESMMVQEALQRDPTDLLHWGFRLRHQLCEADLADEEDERRERAFIDLTLNRDGSYSLVGQLDAERGTIVKKAIHAVNGPRAKGDERTPGQRRAAGFMELARYRLDAGDLPKRGGQRPHVCVTATLETLLGLPGADAAELDFGIPVSGRMVRKMVREGAHLTPVRVDEKGNPLYLGRTVRTAPPKLAKALTIRDRHCHFGACTKPPELCQGDHVNPWSEGGRTDIPNMGLLCGPHNRLKGKGYLPHRLPDGRWVAKLARPPEGGGGGPPLRL